MKGGTAMKKRPTVFFTVENKREEMLSNEYAAVFTKELAQAFKEYFENDHDEWIKVSEQYKTLSENTYFVTENTKNS